MAERATEDVVDGNGENQRGTSHSKGEVIGVVHRGAEVLLCPLHNLHGSRRSKQGTDVDGHVEDGEARVALSGILRVVVEVAHHHLEVSLKQSRTQTDEYQCGQHDH